VNGCTSENDIYALATAVSHILQFGDVDVSTGDGLASQISGYMTLLVRQPGDFVRSVPQKSSQVQTNYMAD
jgi:hypothetical protein